jgi:hypothetical protein
VKRDNFDLPKLSAVHYSAKLHYLPSDRLQYNTRFPLLRFRSALHCGYSGITDIQDGLFFVLTRARTFKKATVRCAIANSKIFAKTFNIFIRGRYLYQ